MKIKVLLVALVLLLCLVGCGAKMQTEENNDNDTSSMFVLVESGVNDVGYRIVYHKETKVMYAISAGYGNTGIFTVMLNADGTPMLYRG